MGSFAQHQAARQMKGWMNKTNTTRDSLGFVKDTSTCLKEQLLLLLAFS